MTDRPKAQMVWMKRLRRISHLPRIALTSNFGYPYAPTALLLRVLQHQDLSVPLDIPFYRIGEVHHSPWRRSHSLGFEIFEGDRRWKVITACEGVCVVVPDERLLVGIILGITDRSKWQMPALSFIPTPWGGIATIGLSKVIYSGWSDGLSEAPSNFGWRGSGWSGERSHRYGLHGALGPDYHRTDLAYVSDGGYGGRLVEPDPLDGRRVELLPEFVGLGLVDYHVHVVLRPSFVSAIQPASVIEVLCTGHG